MTVSWAAEELQTLKLKDKRLVKRAIKILEDLSEHPSKSIPEANAGDWGVTKAVYAFWQNERVDEKEIQQAHFQATSERVAQHGRVLAVQDTTELNYSGKEVAKELGHLANPKSRGIEMHSNIVISEQGVPLGLIDLKVWHRDVASKGKKHQRTKKDTSEKESQRWLDGVLAAEERLAEEVEIIHIADREADIFDLFSLPRRTGSHLLIRVTYNRRVEHEAHYLWEAIRQAPIQGMHEVEVRAQVNRPARLAKTTVRYATLDVCSPSNKKVRPSIPLQFILVEEVDVPDGVEPIIWLLATTLPVSRLDEALQCVQYYAYRWVVERFHFVLKSGCRVEKLYLQEKERLYRAITILSVVAWRLLWLTYQVRETPQAPCTLILQSNEWKALYCFTHHTSTPADEPPTLQEVVFWIARLGGFLGRKGDGDPGPMTIWRGMRHLEYIVSTWDLLHPEPKD